MRGYDANFAPIGNQTRRQARLTAMAILGGLHHLLDFCYPPICALCDQAGAPRSEICENCLKRVQEQEALPACPRCAMPIAEMGALCPHCKGEGHKPFERIVRLSLFRDPVRQVIHQIKYHHRWTLAEFLADRLIE